MAHQRKYPRPKSVPKTDNELPGDKRLSELAASMAIQLALNHGSINPKGMSPVELADAALSWAAKFLSTIPSEALEVVVDRREDLLANARFHRRRKSYDLSALFFAIWIEHTVNLILARALSRKPLAICDKVLRTNFNDKTTWVWHLCGLRPLPKAHLSRMQCVIDGRNAFAHYKWRESKEESAAQLSNALDSIDKTVRFLQKLEAPITDRTIARIAKQSAARD